MLRYKIFFLILGVFLFTSCSTTYRVKYSQNKLNTYVGLSHQELVQRLGAPISEISDGGDGYILVFEGNKELFDYSSWYATKSKTLPKAQFYMTPDGVCYKVQVSNTDPVKRISVGGTIALVLLILLII